MTPGVPGRGHRLAYSRLHVLLTLESLVVVLISVNRKAHGTLAFVADNEFLRWVEVDNMLLALCTVLLYYLVTAHVVHNGSKRWGKGLLALGALFTAGTYLYALSFGNHEITNYLHGRFCSASFPPMCEIVAFNDDVFSDVVFLTGFTLLNVTVMLAQALFPTDRAPLAWDNALLTVNALFIGAGITANIAFEKAGFDVWAVGATTVLALALLRMSPRQPLLRYYAMVYTAGSLATFLVKMQ
ncbi:hypothetical protein ABZT06_44850 [Streptomyces sp. NPDC005483]|uniref:hypothetical protein n=1 Tax=Streptomyces sp. NPDC005483 TaxID=3154882 RepID=UPI0033AD8A4D